MEIFFSYHSDVLISPITQHEFQKLSSHSSFFFSFLSSFFFFFDFTFALKQKCFIKKKKSYIVIIYTPSFRYDVFERGFEFYFFHNLFNVVSVFIPKLFSCYCLSYAQIIIFVTIWLYPIFEA